MQPELRPLSLGEILDRTFQLYRGHFLMFAGISTIAAAIDLVWKLIQTGAIRALQSHVSVQIVGLSSSGFSLLSLLVYVVASAVAMAAINRAVSAVYLGKPTGIALAYQEIKPRWFLYVRLYFVAFFIAWGAATVAVIGMVVAAAFLAKQAGAAAGIFIAVFGLSFLLVFPFGVWMMLRYSLANASCVFEGVGVRAALKRSVFLTTGMRGKIFVMFLLAGTLIMVLTYAALVPMMIGVFRHPGYVSLWSTLFTLLASFVVTSLTTPIYGIALTLFYYDSRIRKEGFDVDWMMQRAMGADMPAELLPGPPVEPSLG